jgi:hypothetical protein
MIVNFISPVLGTQLLRGIPIGIFRFYHIIFFPVTVYDNGRKDYRYLLTGG